MFNATHGAFHTDTEGIFSATEATQPDELRVVVASALARREFFFDARTV
jgi:hypothetical protein